VTMSDNSPATAVTVKTAHQLADAIEAGAQEIVVDGRITGSPSITLPEGTTLCGGELAFLAKGVRLSRDNTLQDITITTTPYEVAVYNDTSVPDAGTLSFNNVTTVGQVYIVAEGDTMTIRVQADGLHVRDADVRGRVEQPHGYGVDVLQGELTLWNRQRIGRVRSRVRRPCGAPRRRSIHGGSDRDREDRHRRRHRPRHPGQDLRRRLRLRCDRGPSAQPNSIDG
jgi:hypothetical protein